MKAMVLAAGYGKRMHPLTLTCPKPLLLAGGKPLLQYHLENLRAAGVREVIVNVSYLGHQVVEWLQSVDGCGLDVSVSKEETPLETAGAIARVIQQLGSDPFLLINGDIWSDFPLSSLVQSELGDTCWGRLVLVPNPAHNPQGDFALEGEVLQRFNPGKPGYTFSGISLLHPDLIRRYPQCREAFPLKEVLLSGIDGGRLHGKLYTGQWWDIGTPERLARLDDYLNSGGR